MRTSTRTVSPASIRGGAGSPCAEAKPASARPAARARSGTRRTVEHGGCMLPPPAGKRVRLSSIERSVPAPEGRKNGEKGPLPLPGQGAPVPDVGRLSDGCQTIGASELPAQQVAGAVDGPVPEVVAALPLPRLHLVAALEVVVEGGAQPGGDPLVDDPHPGLLVDVERAR